MKKVNSIERKHVKIKVSSFFLFYTLIWYGQDRVVQKTIVLK